jgi:MoCo/4Fe-4S cofactor protein with predicted Tat translocation signal
MKRVLTHPAREAKPTLWRSLDELSSSPDFAAKLEREFPQGASEWNGGELSRRNFLQLMGGSMALAGIGLTGCRRPEAYLVAFTQGAEWTIPGKFLYYATTMPRRNGAMPLIATTSDGRPTKLEGNPLHPISNGATDTFAQASVLDLYDPNRSKTIKAGGVKTDAAALGAKLDEIAAAANGALLFSSSGLIPPRAIGCSGSCGTNSPIFSGPNTNRSARAKPRRPRRPALAGGSVSYPTSVAPTKCSRWTAIFSMPRSAGWIRCAASWRAAGSASRARR